MVQILSSDVRDVLLIFRALVDRRTHLFGTVQKTISGLVGGIFLHLHRSLDSFYTVLLIEIHLTRTPANELVDAFGYEYAFAVGFCDISLTVSRC